MNNPIISLEGVEKRFGSNLVVKKMNLEIAEGEFLTLLGPSGCGKTTTLRMIAGFEEASAGVIKVEGERIEDKEPFQRNVNTVFQNYALFPHMTVFNNVAYGLMFSWKGLRSVSRMSFPAVRNSEWRFQERWSTDRRYCFWMNLWVRLT